MSLIEDLPLLCSERLSQEDFSISSYLRSHIDPVLKSSKVLEGLLNMEMNYLPSPNYIPFVQNEIKEHMRRIVTDWMLEVCEEQGCHDKVFPLAVNFMDRFLSLVAISTNQLQLLGSVCLFISSKACESIPLSSQMLIFYTDYSINLEELRNYRHHSFFLRSRKNVIETRKSAYFVWEILVLTRLKWDIQAVTPLEFLDFLIDRITPQYVPDSQTLVRNAKCFIVMCLKEYRFCLHPPSTIATAAVAVAARAMLCYHMSGSSLYQQLCVVLRGIVGLEADIFVSIVAEIENLVASHLKSEKSSVSLMPNESKHQEMGTPTDVQDINF